MRTYDVAPTIEHSYDRSSIVLRTIVGRVEGIARPYAATSYGIGIVPTGAAGRRETGGPLVEGPWGFLFGRATVIDNYGGSAADRERARAEGRYIESVADGDVLRIGADAYVVRVRANAATLEPVE